MEYNKAENLVRLVDQESAGGTLAQALHNMPRSVLEFTNLEYAAPEILHYLLQAIRTGRVRDARGLESSISKLTVVLLSDLVGFDKHRGPMGFVDPDHQGTLRGEDLPSRATSARAAAGMDKVIVFHPLSEETLMEILRRKLLPSWSGVSAAWATSWWSARTSSSTSPCPRPAPPATPKP